MSNRKDNKRKYREKKLFLIAVLMISAVLGVIGLKYITRRYFNRIHTFEEFIFSYKYPVRGVDVSHHNSFIDWFQLKEDGITFTYLKSTEGETHLDRNYQENYRFAKAAGIKVGTYHFFIFGKDGNEQAKHFIENSKINPGDLIPAIDFEHSRANREVLDEKSVNQVIDELKKLEAALFAHFGTHPIIYTNKQCYRIYLKDKFPDNPLWICDLHNEPGDEFDHWSFWQFSHTGKLNGVEDHIDLNYFRGTREEFNNLIIQ